MRKLICLLAVLVLCVSLAAPAFAAEDTFVPSISVKDGPGLVGFADDDGNPVIGKIQNNDGVIDYIEDDCIVVTPVSQAETSKDIPEEARDQLLSIYKQLNNGQMKLPYEKVSANLDPSTMVIRELVDISWLCNEHPEMLALDGTTAVITFDLGVNADTDVIVMAYVNNEWNPVVDVKNNGDGTITCTFDSFGPVAFSVKKDVEKNEPQTGDNVDITLWATLLVVSFVAVAAMFFFYRKRAKNA